MIFENKNFIKLCLVVFKVFICCTLADEIFSSIHVTPQNSTVNEKSVKNISLYLGLDPWIVRIQSGLINDYYCSGFIINGKFE